jgi:hypothetical protein
MNPRLDDNQGGCGGPILFILGMATLAIILITNFIKK